MSNHRAFENCHTKEIRHHAAEQPPMDYDLAHYSAPHINDNASLAQRLDKHQQRIAKSQQWTDLLAEKVLVRLFNIVVSIRGGDLNRPTHEEVSFFEYALMHDLSVDCLKESVHLLFIHADQPVQIAEAVLRTAVAIWNDHCLSYQTNLQRHYGILSFQELIMVLFTQAVSPNQFYRTNYRYQLTPTRIFEHNYNPIWLDSESVIDIKFRLAKLCWILPTPAAGLNSDYTTKLIDSLLSEIEIEWEKGYEVDSHYRKTLIKNIYPNIEAFTEVAFARWIRTHLLVSMG